jgi:glycosyltransferase involved in cell wall biosynthesis
MKPSPRFSIITPTLNRSSMIVSAVESVLINDYPNFEHIIVDGGSTDGTLDVLAQYQHLKVISDPDQGMYDALNKGLERATGEIIGFLNSDDVYAPRAFHQAAKAFQKLDIFAVVGEATIFSRTAGGAKNVLDRFVPPEGSLLELSVLGSPFMNAWFFRKTVFEKIGNFNSNYQIVADRDFMVRFVLSGMEFAILKVLIYEYLHHADSKTFDITDEKFERIVQEHLKMTHSYLQLKGLHKSARTLIRQLRTRETIDMSIRTMTLRQFLKFAIYTFEGLKYDWSWPIQFGKFFSRALIAKIRS